VLIWLVPISRAAPVEPGVPAGVPTLVSLRHDRFIITLLSAVLHLNFVGIKQETG